MASWCSPRESHGQAPGTGRVLCNAAVLGSNQGPGPRDTACGGVLKRTRSVGPVPKWEGWLCPSRPGWEVQEPHLNIHVPTNVEKIVFRGLLADLNMKLRTICHI